ncbi:hypothetical protein RJ035_006849 [Blastomyces gilchristii]
MAAEGKIISAFFLTSVGIQRTIRVYCYYAFVRWARWRVRATNLSQSLLLSWAQAELPGTGESDSSQPSPVDGDRVAGSTVGFGGNSHSLHVTHGARFSGGAHNIRTIRKQTNYVSGLFRNSRTKGEGKNINDQEDRALRSLKYGNLPARFSRRTTTMQLLGLKPSDQGAQITDVIHSTPSPLQEPSEKASKWEKRLGAFGCTLPTGRPLSQPFCKPATYRRVALFLGVLTGFQQCR